MKIVVMGLGYLGTTVAACAAADGHDVVGVDPDPERWTAIANGRSPVTESGLGQLVASAVFRKTLSAHPTPGDFCARADMVVICVATPEQIGDGLDLSQIRAATEQVGTALRSRASHNGPVSIVYRSTLPPGTMDNLIVPLVGDSSKGMPGELFEASYNPEYLREGNALDDYRHPSRIIIGERKPGAAKRLHGFYDNIDAPIYEVPYVTAELAKLADNSLHALKIAFANEIGRYARSLNIHPQELANIMLADERLNISTAYLRPGGAFGGACLAKDTKALAEAINRRGLTALLIGAIAPSNVEHHCYLAQLIVDSLPSTSSVLIYGLGFKPGSIDIRHSPAIELASQLQNLGHAITIFDPDVGNVENFCGGLPSSLQNCWAPNVGEAAGRAALVICWKEAPLDLGAKRVFDFRSFSFS